MPGLLGWVRVDSGGSVWGLVGFVPTERRAIGSLV